MSDLGLDVLTSLSIGQYSIKASVSDFSVMTALSLIGRYNVQVLLTRSTVIHKETGLRSTTRQRRLPDPTDEI